MEVGIKELKHLSTELYSESILRLDYGDVSLYLGTALVRNTNRLSEVTHHIVVNDNLEDTLLEISERVGRIK